MDRNVFVMEHSLEHRCVSIERYGLKFVLKIPVVAPDKNTHSSGYAGIELLGRQAPLLDGIMLIDILINVVGKMPDLTGF